MGRARDRGQRSPPRLPVQSLPSLVPVLTPPPRQNQYLYLLQLGGLRLSKIVTDYRAWCVKNGNDYKVCEAPAHRISTADLDKVAKDQGVELRTGDILFLRTGYIEWYNNSDTEERVRVAKKYPPDIAGIEQTEESVRWLWYDSLAPSCTCIPLTTTPIVVIYCCAREGC